MWSLRFHAKSRVGRLQMKWPQGSQNGFWRGKVALPKECPKWWKVIQVSRLGIFWRRKHWRQHSHGLISKVHRGGGYISRKSYAPVVLPAYNRSWWVRVSDTLILSSWVGRGGKGGGEGWKGGSRRGHFWHFRFHNLWSWSIYWKCWAVSCSFFIWS